MKRLFLSIVASSLLLSSCSNDDVVTSSLSNEISLETVTGSVSRSNTFFPGNTYSVDKLWLYSTVSDNLKKSYFEDANAVYSRPSGPGDTGWSFTTNKHYWPEDDIALNFYAVSLGPRNSSKWDDTNINFNKTANNNKVSFEYSVPLSASEQDDVLYAVTPNITKKTNNGVVPLQCKHALSCINFSFEVKNAHFAIYVKSVSVSKILNQGTITIVYNKDSGATYSSVPKESGTSVTETLEIDDAYVPCFRKYSGALNEDGSAVENGAQLFAVTSDDTKKLIDINGTQVSVSQNDGNLFVLPQESYPWIPAIIDGFGRDVVSTDGNGYQWNAGSSFFIIECKIYHIADPDGVTFVGPNKETLIYGNKDGSYRKILVPMATNSVDDKGTSIAQWNAGTRYSYKFIFGDDDKTNMGYDPDDPSKPALDFSPIKFVVTDVNNMDVSTEDFEITN